MSITQDAVWAASPSTTRGQPTPISADSKGERIAYASNKSIFVRSIDKPEISKQYTGHTAQTSVARFSPSGFYVASGDVTGSVRVWDCQGEGATKGEYHIIAGRINDIAWDGDSQRIIAVGAGKERFGHCITADSGNSVGEISGHSSQINCVAIRQQRPLRAATGSDDTAMVFYHGPPFKFNTMVREKHNRFIYGTAFSPDGARLVTVGADKRIWLYDGKTGEVQKQVGDAEHAGSIFGVSWSADSKSFVTCSADQTVKVWDAEAGSVKHSWRLGDEGVVSVGAQQVGVVWPPGRSDGLIISLDLDGNLNYLVPGKDRPVRIVKGHQKNVAALTATSKDKIWSGSSDGGIRAWDTASGTAIQPDGESHANYVAGLASSGSAGRVYSVGWDDTLRTIDAGSASFAATGPTKVTGQPRGVAVPSSKVTLVATPSGLDVFSDIEPAGTVDLKTSPTCVAATTSHAAVGDDAKNVHIFTVSGTSIKPSRVLDANLPSGPVTLAFSPDESHLAVGLASGGIQVVKTADWSVVTTRWSAHTARVTSIAWNPNSTHAVSGSLDTNVHIWSLASPGKRVKAGNAHKDGVNGVVWLDEGTVVSSGADAAVKVWKVGGLE